MTQLRPFYENVQAHYDLSNDFYALFLDPSMVYSCAYFERDDMTLAEAQTAKLDLSLGKCDLRPGHRLLDIGCGWGAGSRRAAEKFGANVTALTLSRAQHVYARRRLQERPLGTGSVDYRLQGWEEFEEPVDRIISIAAFEAFRVERYTAFFERCRALLPDDGRMLLHTIVWSDADKRRQLGVKVEHEHVLFGKFIRKEVFPGGMLCQPSLIERYARDAGFKATRIQSLRLHYVRTLNLWAAALEQARDKAVALMSQQVYDRYMKYMAGCARYFRSGHIDLMQFTLEVA